MLKAASLRTAIEAVLPGMGIEPDRLKIWVERGSVRSTQSETFGFEWTYRLTILIEGMVEHPSIVTIAILYWLRINQPELLNPKSKAAFDFDADIIDNQASDMIIDLTLTESVSAVQRDDGGFDMQHQAEPDPLFDDDVSLTGDYPPPPLTQLWLTSGEKILPDEPPLGATVQPPGEFPE